MDVEATSHLPYIATATLQGDRIHNGVATRSKWLAVFNTAAFGKMIFKPKLFAMA